jgi:hypothetical protein
VEAKKEVTVIINNKIIEILGDVSKIPIQVNEVRIHFYVDSKIQKKMKSIWKKSYQLSIE